MRAIATDPCWLVMILGSGCRRVFDSLKEVCKQWRREGAITHRVATGYGSACLNQKIGGLAHQVSLQAYWSNNSFSANMTNDVPNESRLEPQHWGRGTVE